MQNHRVPGLAAWAVTTGVQTACSTPQGQVLYDGVLPLERHYKALAVVDVVVAQWIVLNIVIDMVLDFFTGETYLRSASKLSLLVIFPISIRG